MRGMKAWLPFQSLRGQREEIERVLAEKEKADLPELSEDEVQDIDKALRTLRRGDKAEVTFFDDGRVYTRKEIFQKVDLVERRVVFLGFSLVLGHLLGIRKLPLS